MALQKKPPVVTIMGHVDHGKTSLLDFIRKSRLVAKEVGEITQAIGAYQVEFQSQKITFIDTPGHEAFTKMRQRGAVVADMVVLVVAANDGVMPQTEESIKIIKEANVPFLVAVNKIDLPEANIDRVKAQLAENEVFVEGYGGKIVAIPLSAKTGQGIDQLLEMILLTAEVSEIKADPKARLEAVVIESKFDKNCGCTATLLVKNGQIRTGDQVWLGSDCAKIRMMRNDCGEVVEKALPGDPVLVLGFNVMPEVSSLVTSWPTETERIEEGAKKPVSTDKPRLKIILKTDVTGSLEAILGCLPGEIQVMDKGVGEITESDIMLAKNFGAEIYGFNLSLSSGIKKLAETEKVKVKTYKIIYDLLEELRERASGNLESEVKLKILGKAEILAVFKMKGEKIAGCRVLEGKINKVNPLLIKRGEVELGKTKIASFKEKKQDIAEALSGTEFGAIFTPELDFQQGDVVISYSL